MSNKRNAAPSMTAADKIFATSPQELAQNRQGRLSAEQTAVFTDQRALRRELIGRYILGVLLGSLVMLPFMLTGVAAFTIGWLTGIGGIALGINRYLARRKQSSHLVETLHGRVLLEADAKKKRYLLILPDRGAYLNVPEEVWAAFDEQTAYTLYTVRGGRQLVAAEEGDPLPPLRGPARLQALLKALPRRHPVYRARWRALRRTLLRPVDLALRKAYNVTEQDLPHNRRGDLSPRQRRALTLRAGRNALIWAVLTGAMLLLAAYTLLVDPTLLLAFGPYLLGIPVLLLAGIPEFRKFWRRRSDLHAVQLDTLTATLHAKTTRPLGNGIARYTLMLGDVAVAVPREAYDLAQVGASYSVHYNPQGAAGPGLLPLDAVIALEQVSAAPPTHDRASERLAEERADALSLEALLQQETPSDARALWRE